MGYFARMAIIASTFATPVCAQGTCPGTDIILDLAQQILTGRADLNRFEQGRIGAEAAYLALHYVGPTDTTLALIDAMAAEPRHTEALDLAAAYRGIAGLALIDPDPVVAIATAGPSLQRAVILADRGETYARLMGQALNIDPLTEGFNRFTAGRLVVYLLADQDDQMRLDVADAAVRNDLPEIALYLLADRVDQTALFDVLLAYPENTNVQSLADPMQVLSSGATLRTGQMLPYATPPQDAEMARSRRNYFDTLRSLWLGTPSDFLGIFLNQSGRDQAASDVARLVLAQVEGGQLNPVTDPDLVWLLEYRALAKDLGRDYVQQNLTGFEFPAMKIRHFAGTALQSLDIILARETLGDFVRGTDAALPPRPPLLSDDFAWDAWVRVAQAVAAGEFGGVGFFDASEFAIAAELLAEAGQWRAAAGSIDPMARPMDRLTLVRDMMLRVDRLCDAALVQPGQSMMQTGGYLWKF